MTRSASAVKSRQCREERTTAVSSRPVSKPGLASICGQRISRPTPFRYVPRSTTRKYCNALAYVRYPATCRWGRTQFLKGSSSSFQMASYPSCLSLAAYDLKKLRGKQMVEHAGKTRRYQPMLNGLRVMAALLLLRDKVVRPMLAAAQPLRQSRGTQNPPIDRHYETMRSAMQEIFHELGIAT